MLSLGYSPDEIKQKGTALTTGVANGVTLNQLPKIAAYGAAQAGRLGLTDDTYESALDRAYANRETIKKANPYVYGSGDIVGGAALPFGGASKLGRIGSGAFQSAAYETGEKGATNSDILSSALQGGIFGTALEAIPVAGKTLKFIGDWGEQASLGLKKSAMRKSMVKNADKTLLGQGYDSVKKLIKEGKGDADSLDTVSRVFAYGDERAKAFAKIANDEIVKNVQKQEDILFDSFNQTFKKTKLITLPKSAALAVELKPGSNFDKAVKSFKGGDVKGAGGITKFPEAEKYKAAYDKLGLKTA